jgi:hypothetical protein
LREPGRAAHEPLLEFVGGDDRGLPGEPAREAEGHGEHARERGDRRVGAEDGPGGGGASAALEAAGETRGEARGEHARHRSGEHDEEHEQSVDPRLPRDGADEEEDGEHHCNREGKPSTPLPPARQPLRLHSHP